MRNLSWSFKKHLVAGCQLVVVNSDAYIQGKRDLGHPLWRNWRWNSWKWIQFIVDAIHVADWRQPENRSCLTKCSGECLDICQKVSTAAFYKNVCKTYFASLVLPYLKTSSRCCTERRRWRKRLIFLGLVCWVSQGETNLVWRYYLFIDRTFSRFHNSKV